MTRLDELIDTLSDKDVYILVDADDCWRETTQTIKKRIP